MQFALNENRVTVGTKGTVRCPKPKRVVSKTRAVKPGKHTYKSVHCTGNVINGGLVTTSKTRQIVNEETSTSSSCPLPLSILNSIPHVVMRTVSDEEARKAKSKVHRLQTGTGHGTQKKKHQGENTGRWTKEEHCIFLQGLEKYGKEWKEISHMIPTRSVVQIRTHAQKYFQKVAKTRAKEGKLDLSSGEHSQIVSTASTSSSTKAIIFTSRAKRSVKEKGKRKCLNFQDSKQRRVGNTKRQRRSAKIPSGTRLMNDDLQSIPLIIKAPPTSCPSNTDFMADDFDDEMIGTPKSVAELFNSEINSRCHKNSTPDLTFLDDAIGHFYFDIDRNDQVNPSPMAFDLCNFNTDVVAISSKSTARNADSSVVQFEDLDVDLSKSDFMDDITQSGSSMACEIDSDNNEVYDCGQAVSEDEFISGLLV